MKYRILNNKELEPLKDDFVKFLSANTVTGEDWAKIKSNKPNEALKLVEIFSDIVWEKALDKIKYLEHRDDKYLKVFYCGENKIELLAPINEDSPISKFLINRKHGMHHIAFEVDDIIEAIQELKENNIQVLSDTYSIGAEGYKVVFIHPRSTGGVLVELAEKPE